MAGNSHAMELLSDADLRFLDPERGSSLRQDPDRLESLLDAPGYLERLAADSRSLLQVTPYLLFQLILRQAARDLGDRGFVMEWAAPRQRVPVYDAVHLREALLHPRITSYLCELLASFTHVHSGVVAWRTGALLRRQRYSELDVRSLVDLLDVVSDVDRFHLERRIAEVALFLTGVFPDFVANRTSRLGTLTELEELGIAHYRLAARHELASRSGSADLLASMAEQFSRVQHALNFVADRYLRERWGPWFSVG